eukprot:2845298-Alexandrium_andersonii.AAC.1
MPTNFEDCLFDTYLRLPNEAMPKGPCSGRYNYTVFPKAGSKIRIEVHLYDKRFFVKCNDSGCKVDQPGVKWGAVGGIQKAWQMAKAKANW